MRRYRFVGPILAQGLQQANLILAQTRDDADRYVRLGAPPDRVAVTGNTKFYIDRDKLQLRPALKQFADGKQILVAGSTAPGEDRIVLNAFRNLAQRFPEAGLAIAPRHLEDLAGVEAELRGSGFDYIKASTLPPSGLANLPVNGTKVLLVDTMGELRGLYKLAVIAFVGGSLIPGRGGQNMGEPAAVSVPVLFGPYYENQRQVGDALVEGGGARVVADSAQLEDVCAEWLSDAVLRRTIGARACEVAEKLSGGAVETLRHLKALITHDDP